MLNKRRLLLSTDYLVEKVVELTVVHMSSKDGRHCGLEFIYIHFSGFLRLDIGVLPGGLMRTRPMCSKYMEQLLKVMKMKEVLHRFEAQRSSLGTAVFQKKIYKNPFSIMSQPWVNCESPCA